MQRVLVALALGSAAAFAPAAQPRTSVVRFMDEDALKSAASVVIIYSIYHRRGDPMGDALSESALARGASSSTRSMSDALSESALSRHAIAQEQDSQRRSRRVQPDRRRRGAQGHRVAVYCASHRRGRDAVVLLLCRAVTQPAEGRRVEVVEVGRRQVLEACCG